MLAHLLLHKQPRDAARARVFSRLDAVSERLLCGG
jgi:hypothetical protein